MVTACMRDPSEAIPIINALIKCIEGEVRTGLVKSLHPDICEAIISRPHGRAVQWGGVGIGKRKNTVVFVDWFKWRGMTYMRFDVKRDNVYLYQDNGRVLPRVKIYECNRWLVSANRTRVGLKPSCIDLDNNENQSANRTRVGLKR